MPVGNYRLTANTIGYQQNDNKIRPYGVYLYAENSGIESRAEAHSLEFGGLKDGVVSEAAPQPRNTVLEFLAMDGTIKIGFKVANTNCNWVAVDNFKLEYLGKGEGGVAGILLFLGIAVGVAGYFYAHRGFNRHEVVEKPDGKDDAHGL